MGPGYGAGAFGAALRGGLGGGHATVAAASASAAGRLRDEALIEIVGRRSELEPREVLTFRARADYMALLGEDLFKTALPVRCLRLFRGVGG